METKTDNGFMFFRISFLVSSFLYMALISGCASACAIKSMQSSQSNKVCFEFSALPGCLFFLDAQKIPADTADILRDVKFSIKNLGNVKMVVFQSSSPNNHSHLVKRAVLAPGEEIEMDKGLRFVYSFRRESKELTDLKVHGVFCVEFVNHSSAERARKFLNFQAERPADVL